MSTNGGIRWHTHWVNVSHVLGEEYVAFEEIEEIDDGLWSVSFGPLVLGRFDERRLRIVDANGYASRNPSACHPSPENDLSPIIPTAHGRDLSGRGPIAPGTPHDAVHDRRHAERQGDVSPVDPARPPVAGRLSPEGNQAAENGEADRERTETMRPTTIHLRSCRKKCIAVHLTRL